MGSEMCIRDRSPPPRPEGDSAAAVTPAGQQAPAAATTIAAVKRQTAVRAPYRRRPRVPRRGRTGAQKSDTELATTSAELATTSEVDTTKPQVCRIAIFDVINHHDEQSLRSSHCSGGAILGRARSNDLTGRSTTLALP